MRSITDRRPPQRSDARRDAILDALERSLQESSLEEVNLTEIAGQAGVSRSAFYFYFENKAAAVAALMERMYDDTFFVTDVFTSVTDSPRTRVYTMLGGLFETWERHRHLFRARLEARGSSTAVREMWDSARESFVEPVAGMIRAERAAGRAPDGLDASLLASVLLEFNDRMLERLTLGGTLTRKQLMDGAAAIWLSTVYGVTSTEAT